MLFCNHVVPSLNIRALSMLDPPFIHALSMLSRDLDINSKDSNGDLLLMMVVCHGQAESVNYLLSRGALYFLSCTVKEPFFYSLLWSF